jgi:hypothetical protein
MRSLGYLVVAGLFFAVGIFTQAARQPAPPTYVVKAEPIRCDLISRVEKRKAKVHL